MSDIEFPYANLRGSKIPLISICLHLPDEAVEIAAFVDSGATYTLVRAEEIKDMNFNFKTGKQKMIQVGDGGFIPVYLHKMKLEIGNKAINAIVGFSEKLGIEFNILGRRDIFETFKVCFNDKAAKITFHEL